MMSLRCTLPLIALLAQHEPKTRCKAVDVLDICTALRSLAPSSNTPVIYWNGQAGMGQVFSNICLNIRFGQSHAIGLL